jgi:GNAT superfamily N-acetyltransferase
MLTVRVANVNDIETIAIIHEVCWRNTYQFMPEEVLQNRDRNYRKTQWENWFKEDKANQDEALFVFEEEGKTVGFCMCKPNDDKMLIGAQGELHAIYVLPEHRKFGISYLAMYTLSKHLIDCGYSPLCLWTFQNNKIWRWYERLGFKKMIARNRRINNVDIPEFGMIHLEPLKLLELTERNMSRML